MCQKFFKKNYYERGGEKGKSEYSGRAQSYSTSGFRGVETAAVDRDKQVSGASPLSVTQRWS